ncbi:MAG: TetR/AcrR family transcriptional regulator [Rhizobiales bacterium]|nr:TetR/AcrR family transcriptional regulator [Hyphomicrobiales bacterium]
MPESAALRPAENDKRAQILEGAGKVFFARGFDGASMSDIAAAAGVSKGTLYVYFENKERLFAALVEEHSREIGESGLRLDPTDTDLRGALTKTARAYLEVLAQPDHVAWLRTVIGAAEKFPELGQTFVDSGPRRAAQKLSDWFRAHISRGRLKIDNVEIAAWQFMMMIQGPILVPMLYGGEARPSSARIEEVVKQSVDTFLAAYAKKTS